MQLKLLYYNMFWLIWCNIVLICKYVFLMKLFLKLFLLCYYQIVIIILTLLNTFFILIIISTLYFKMTYIEIFHCKKLLLCCQGLKSVLQFLFTLTYYAYRNPWTFHDCSFRNILIKYSLWLALRCKRIPLSNVQFETIRE